LKKQIKQKEEKNNVALGQSVTSAILNNEERDNDSSNVVIPYMDTDYEHELENKDVVPEYLKPTKKNLSIGDFVLVNVQLGKRKKTIYVYAAVIKKITLTTLSYCREPNYFEICSISIKKLCIKE